MTLAQEILLLLEDKEIHLPDSPLPLELESGDILPVRIQWTKAISPKKKETADEKPAGKWGQKDDKKDDEKAKEKDDVKEESVSLHLDIGMHPKYIKQYFKSPITERSMKNMYRTLHKRLVTILRAHKDIEKVVVEDTFYLHEQPQWKKYFLTLVDNVQGTTVKEPNKDGYLQIIDFKRTKE